MTDFSIIGYDTSSKDTITLPPYYYDFNIDRIVEDINAFWKEDVSAFFKYYPVEEGVQEYRKAIYNDIGKEGIFEALMEFRDGMKQRKKIIGDKEHTGSGLQDTVMSLNEIRCYAVTVDSLAKKLSEVQLESEGMIKLSKLLKDYTEGSSFINMSEKVTELRKSLDGIPLKLSYQDHFLSVSFEETEGKYDDFLKGFLKEKAAGREKENYLQYRNPMGDAVEITPLEKEILEVVYKKYPQIFNELKQFVDENKDYAKAFVLQLADEIVFYLSYYTFEYEMKKRGLYFTPARKSERNILAAEDLYDLALACQLSRDEVLPVSNDTTLREGENFFVLTGPNQGGKTTFARSLGQLVFFSKLGLPVPARRAELPFYHRILTHFSVEESVETGKGKLAEELTRLAPMMEDKSQKNDFVVINELFTTAANYDAVIMGKRVLDHFVNQNAHGIYVTHLQELSREDKGIVSLRAMMNEEHKQNFKIVRSNDPALESSILLVEKHRLQYEQVKKRLGGED